MQIAVQASSALGFAQESLAGFGILQSHQALVRIYGLAHDNRVAEPQLKGLFFRIKFHTLSLIFSNGSCESAAVKAFFLKLNAISVITGSRATLVGSKTKTATEVTKTIARRERLSECDKVRRFRLTSFRNSFRRSSQATNKL